MQCVRSSSVYNYVSVENCLRALILEEKAPINAIMTLFPGADKISRRQILWFPLWCARFHRLRSSRSESKITRDKNDARKEFIQGPLCRTLGLRQRWIQDVDLPGVYNL